MSGHGEPRSGPSWTVRLGLAVVVIGAAALSFDALRALALAVAIPVHLAWLLPVVVDAGAAVACGVWLSRRSPLDAAQFAGRMTWTLLGTTVVGNAGQLGMHAHEVIPPWPVAVAVGAIAPAVLGGTVHLLVLLGRAPAADPGGTVVALPAVPPAPPHASPARETTPPALPVDSPAGDEVDGDRAAELLAAGVGRRKLSRELGITEHEARQLLAGRANGAAR